jgi:hypothetical protein
LFLHDSEQTTNRNDDDDDECVFKRWIDKEQRKTKIEEMKKIKIKKSMRV